MGSLTREKRIPSDTCGQDKTRQDNALFGVLYSTMYIDFIIDYIDYIDFIQII